MQMDFQTITKLALMLLGKRQELVGLVKDAMSVFERAKSLFPELGTALGAKSASAADYSVKWLQGSLNKLMNAGLTVDGDYGEATREAVKKYQEAHGLEADGWAGVQTQASIVDALK
jgi:peptidoglycan hydrolase-like protein with peptidoglycan-binding domain